jgi:hypothetical protein
LSLFLARPANAAPGPTTTAPPRRPTDDDGPLLAFGQQVELAARELYDLALLDNRVEFTDEQRAVVEAIREAHEAYANSLSSMLGRNAPNQPADGVVDALRREITSVDTFFAAAALLESTAVATHRELLGELQGTQGAELIASILIVEARHSTVLAHLGGATDLDDLLFRQEANPVTLEG